LEKHSEIPGQDFSYALQADQTPRQGADTAYDVGKTMIKESGLRETSVLDAAVREPSAGRADDRRRKTDLFLISISP
jgi:hypothetical protein